MSLLEQNNETNLKSVNIEIVEILLNNGADKSILSIKNDERVTAWMIKAVNLSVKWTKVKKNIRLLLKQNVDDNFIDEISL